MSVPHSADIKKPLIQRGNEVMLILIPLIYFVNRTGKIYYASDYGHEYFVFYIKKK
jgi:hypothetical protein